MTHLPLKKIQAFAGACLMIFGMGASPAVAGFQISGAPQATPAVAPVTAPANVPTAELLPPPVTEVAPEIQWAAPANQAMAPAAVPAVNDEMLEPLPLVAEAQTETAIPEKAHVMRLPPENMVTGFGSDLPLAIAVQQVVPPGYKVAFSEGASAGVTVSWNGGKPWQAVLKDMIAPQDLSYHLMRDTVVITPAGNSAAIAPTPLVATQETVVDQAPPPVMMKKEVIQNTPDSITIRRQKPRHNVFKKMGLTSEDESGMVNDISGDTSSVAVQDPPPVMATESPVVDVETPVAEVADAGDMPLMIVKPVNAVPPAAEPSLTVTPAMEPQWNASKGETLRDALKQWSQTAGVDLYWSIDYDYRLTDNVVMGGSYDEAVSKLMDMFNQSRPQPYGELHQSVDGPRVLVIKSYDLAG